MSENQTTTETKAVATAENTSNGNIPETASLIERADSVAKRMEEANKKAEELIMRQEKLAARSMLGGRTQAGSIQKTAEEEEKEKIDAEVKARLARYK